MPVFFEIPSFLSLSIVTGNYISQDPLPEKVGQRGGRCTKTGEWDKGGNMVYFLFLPLVSCLLYSSGGVSSMLSDPPAHPFLCPSSCGATHVSPAPTEQPCFWALRNSPSSPITAAANLRVVPLVPVWLLSFPITRMTNSLY